jgi:hypothetical protein
MRIRFMSFGLPAPDYRLPTILKRQIIITTRKRRSMYIFLRSWWCSGVGGRSSFHFPGFHIRIPAAIILAAFNVKRNGKGFADLQLAGIDLISPDRNAYFLRVLAISFNNYILFLPFPVFAAAGLQRQQLY